MIIQAFYRLFDVSKGQNFARANNPKFTRRHRLSHGTSFIVKSRFIQYWIGLGYWMTEFNQTSAIVLLFSIKMHFH